MPNLTASQLLWLHGLIRATPALSGHDFALLPGHVQVTAPREFSVQLETLFRQVGSEPVGQWPTIVDEYFRRLITAGLDPVLADVPFKDLVGRLLPRLFSADSPVARKSYARPVTPGLVELLAVDNPESVEVLNDSDVDGLGLGVLRGAAMRNLLDRPQSELVKVERAGTWIVRGDDHTAAELLTLPRLVAAVAGEVDLSGGVVVAVPAQTTVVFHVPGDRIDLAVARVAHVAGAVHREIPHPLSPEVFLWRDGDLTPVGI